MLALVVLVIAAYFLTRPPGPDRGAIPPAAVKQKEKGASPPPASVPPAVTASIPVIQPAPERHSSVPPALPPEAEVPAGSSGRALLAIIIDDMGSSLQEARALKKIGVPLDFAIIPGLRYCREVAGFAAESGIETMIHMPMQSKGWPERRLEENGLLVAMEDQEIRQRLEEYLKQVPGAVGANNHMGSEFTERADRMRVVMEMLKGSGMFFVDSVTSPASAGGKVAREAGIRSSRRQVFLDNEQNEAYIAGQLQQAVRLARKQGAAIAIGHPHPATLAALSTHLPRLAEQGVTLVPVSRIVR